MFECCICDTFGDYGSWLYSGSIDDCYDGRWQQAKSGDEVCMDELGCFTLTDEFFHPQYRPCNVLPQSRSHINTRFVLFTKGNIKEGRFLVASNETNLKGSALDRNLPTKFIVHGFKENPLQNPWVLIMMKELLENEDQNVVIVDWNRGSFSHYIEAVANTMVVGAEVAALIDAMQKAMNVEPSNIHIIGHGLGAHVAAYAAQRMPTKPSRITGLDPSYKYFCNMDAKVRLDPSDATFVDIIHTELNRHDSGHGGCHNLGHVDFFPNGGGEHPGCHSLWGSAASTHRYFNGYRGVSTCKHQRAVALYIATIRSNGCRMVGYWCRSYKAFLRGECADCGSDGSQCAVMGYRANEYIPFRNSNNTSMYLITGAFPPFCLYEYRLRMTLNTSVVKEEHYSQSGSLLVVLKGERKPLFVHLSFYSLHRGDEYTFLVTTPINIGQVKNLTVKWEEFGSYAEDYHSGQAIWYFQSSNADVGKIFVTLLNAIGSGQQNRSPTEMSFCRNEEADKRNTGWMNYTPTC